MLRFVFAISRLAFAFALVTVVIAATILCADAQAPTTSASGSAANQTGSIVAQNSASPVNVSVTSQAAHKFETNPILSLPEMFARQWIPDR